MRADAGLLRDRLDRADREALDELFRRHVDGVFRTARRLLRSDADAEDATQAAFESPLRSLRDLRDGAAFGPWLRRIGVRSALHFLRRRPAPEMARGGRTRTRPRLAVAG